MFLGGSPKPLSGRPPAAPLMMPIDCVQITTPFPRKSCNPLFQTCKRMPPPKPPLTAVSELDPIYPYLPFLFWAFFLAMIVPIGVALVIICVWPRKIAKINVTEVGRERYASTSFRRVRTCSIQPFEYNRTIIARRFLNFHARLLSVGPFLQLYYRREVICAGRYLLGL